MARTGEILYEKNAKHPAAPRIADQDDDALTSPFRKSKPAGMSLDTKVTSHEIRRLAAALAAGAEAGPEDFAIRYLIRAAAVKSANDAASATWRRDHRRRRMSTFAKRMTRTARQLGMNDTTFKNANGLTADGHLSTAL